MATKQIPMADTSSKTHTLYDKWVLWAHLPHDTDWTMESYIRIMTISSCEDAVELYKSIPEKLTTNCMLFLMREGITPTWEDGRNRNGGCFSYKIPNKSVSELWAKLSFSVMGETISRDPAFLRKTTGVTISPKRAFCIIKVWMEDMDFQNPRLIEDAIGLPSHGCLFKKHKPNY
tara:strand:- start:4114 stop:4638 length:525 start_codon:yes stop_codon:yes gene_type:complete